MSYDVNKYSCCSLKLLLVSADESWPFRILFLALRAGPGQLYFDTCQPHSPSEEAAASLLDPHSARRNPRNSVGYANLDFD